MIPLKTDAARKKPRMVTIETPDHFELEFQVAGIGSRFLAYFVDKMLQFGAILTVMLIFGLFLLVSEEFGIGWNLTAKLRGHLFQWVLAILILMYGIIVIGYFMLFEYFWSGSTPGKRWQSIRVIRRDGRPLSFFDSAVRNILRFVDVVGDFYPIGLIVMFVDPLNRRLGDMAASTLVVAEREVTPPDAQTTDKEGDVIDSELRSAVRAMTPEDYQLVSKFLARRNGMDDEPRLDLGVEIFERILRRAFRKGADGADPESTLEKVETFYREHTRIL